MGTKGLMLLSATRGQPSRLDILRALGGARDQVEKTWHLACDLECNMYADQRRKLFVDAIEHGLQILRELIKLDETTDSNLARRVNAEYFREFRRFLQDLLVVLPGGWRALSPECQAVLDEIEEWTPERDLKQGYHITSGPWGHPLPELAITRDIQFVRVTAGHPPLTEHIAGI